MVYAINFDWANTEKLTLGLPKKLFKMQIKKKNRIFRIIVGLLK